jgi:ribonucleotide monophosphatase NagD (HAD superfamily)
MIEAALEARYRDAAPRFVGLGKPHPAIFEAGLERLGDVPRERVVMVGDQLDTDIRGARGVGLDAVLVGTGVSRATAADGPRPLATLAELRG